MPLLAHDGQLDRLVALKIPKLESDSSGTLSRRFLREARSAATLSHPNICPIYDVGELDGRQYIAMAYIQGRPLNAYIKPSKRQPERQIASVIRKVALALDEAHCHNVLHRDLKPANIMIDQRGGHVVPVHGGNPGDHHERRAGSADGTKLGVRIRVWGNGIHAVARAVGRSVGRDCPSAGTSAALACPGPVGNATLVGERRIAFPAAPASIAPALHPAAPADHRVSKPACSTRVALASRQCGSTDRHDSQAGWNPVDRTLPDGEIPHHAESGHPELQQSISRA